MDTPAPHVLLVEGNDEVHVVRKLLCKHKLQPRFEVTNMHGFVLLRDSISNELNVSGRRTLGILADANDHPDRRWQSIAGELRTAGCDVPDLLGSAGTVFIGPRQTRVGIWLMPDNQRPGELEDFVADMIPTEDPLWPYAQKYIDGIPANERRFKPGKVTRAQVHAWLATRERPRPMGGALVAGDLNHDAATARRFVDWLRKLFQL